MTENEFEKLIAELKEAFSLLSYDEAEMGFYMATSAIEDALRPSNPGLDWSRLP